ncbi:MULTISPECIES: branched-chain amino acid ABC transporter permease [unclassified Janthinobacterium]|uniref:branched-chain amino acid ABC transporter permease n=1 Tax=unclassified Janthinobacterium TaxID=2610881 RepID=UPI0003473526|nr:MULTISPECIES: branched-chain amino acid ABC transporter permease [unclassified Janthinobacterium]MEC5160789.1 branched-chain amino acid transport system permease protein [Janthinobacterium sp. CG_S6]
MKTLSSISFAPMNLPRYLVWGGYALALAVAPLLFSKGGALSLLCQMGTMMLLGLSYNMLLGQGGMLSFGHAVYAGLGAFCAIHAMNLTAAGGPGLPTSLIPLLGGVAGMFFGMLFGYVTTKKSGTTFAMITLGLVELVFAASLMFPDFFGGEGGVTTNRVIGAPVLGISYGPQIQVYYLIAFWLFLGTVAMFAFTHTPLGRMLNAVRDNPERVGFIGYDTQWVRYLTLILSSFFAGVAGGLSAINFEIVSAENVSAARSGAILLFTFIGGIGFFFGPLLGAIVGVLFSVLLSDFSHAWQLYLGLFFIVMVRYAPAGLASLLLMLMRVASAGRFGLVGPRLLGLVAVTLAGVLGLVAGIEMLYHLTLESANGSVMPLFGFQPDTRAALPWLVAGALLLFGVLGYRRLQPGFYTLWSDVNADIAAQQKGAGR